MLFKSELTTVTTMEHMDQIVKALGAAGITAYTKTQDNFSGGLFQNRRTTGTFGMDSAARFIYKIYVKREQLEQAKTILATLA